MLKKAAEIFTIILSTQQIKELPPLDRGEEIRKIDKQQFERWQNQWGGRVWRFEQQGGAGARITKAEKRAGAKSHEFLTGDDPDAQTFYHIANRSKDVVMFDIQVKIRK